MRKWHYVLPVLLGLTLAACDENSNSVELPPDSDIFQASGADVQAAFDDFTAALGGENRGGEPTSFPDGFRPINWDAIGDGASAPAFLPGDFFNFTEAPRARGVVFTEPGESAAPAGDLFMVSANDGTGTPIEFGNFNPDYPSLFATFSEERLFAYTDDEDTTFDIIFFVPDEVDTTTPAGVNGFGAIFTDVDDADDTTLEYFDPSGESLGRFAVPVSGGDEGLSFLGVTFADETVARVRVTVGSQPVALGEPDGTTGDVVVMDDFRYGEPQPLNNGEM